MIIDIVTQNKHEVNEFIRNNSAAHHLIKTNTVPTKHYKFRYILEKNYDSLVKEIEDQEGTIYRLITPSSLEWFLGPLSRNELARLAGLLSEKIITTTIKNKTFTKIGADIEKIKQFQKDHDIPRDVKRLRFNNYKNKNKEKIASSIKRWKQRNKEHVTRYNNNYTLNRRATDPLFKLKTNLRTRVNTAIKKNYKTGRTLDLLGCSIQELKLHLERQFKPGMSWENYGKKGWSIDHIKPCVLFDLSKEQEQRDCFNFSNLQPLWCFENSIKSSKYYLK